MIFLGDIASPDNASSISLNNVFSENNTVFSGKRLICNFEGLIYDGFNPKSNEPILYNHSSVLKVLNREQKSVLCLANNHILDLPGQFNSTINLINAEGLINCGAARNIKEAGNPVVFSEGNQTVALFNACWNFLLYNHKNPRSGVYVAELKEEKLIQNILDYKKNSPDSLIVVFLHWSLDLEVLPYPMYRKFSQDLIDAGVNIVVGCHSHCVQGGEKYKNGYIIYSLGNFFIPNGTYANNNLTFPDFARIQLAFEWNPESDIARCHWFEYHNTDNEHKLNYLESENFSESKWLKKYSEFDGMNAAQYIKYFKSKRRKSFLIPVYTDYHNKIRNNFYTLFLKIRANFAHTLAKMHLIKWQN